MYWKGNKLNWFRRMREEISLCKKGSILKTWRRLRDWGGVLPREKIRRLVKGNLSLWGVSFFFVQNSIGGKTWVWIIVSNGQICLKFIRCRWENTHIPIFHFEWPENEKMEIWDKRRSKRIKGNKWRSRINTSFLQFIITFEEVKHRFYINKNRHEVSG